jgi:Bacterial PH domain
MGRVKEPLEWRTSAGAKVLTYAAVLLCAPLGIGAAIAAAVEGDLAAAAWLAVAALAGSAAAIVYVRRVRVVCSSNDLLVVSLLRERRFNWGAIASAESGYFGVTVHLKNGRRVVATAVQKSNASTLMGRRAPSDDLVDYINDRVSRRR